MSGDFRTHRGQEQLQVSQSNQPCVDTIEEGNLAKGLNYERPAFLEILDFGRFLAGRSDSLSENAFFDEFA